MLPCRFWNTFTLFVFCFAGQLTAADAPFEIIPSPTALVIRFHSPDASIDKLAECIKKLQPAPEETASVLTEDNVDWADSVRGGIETTLKRLGESADLEQDWWDLEQDWWIYCSDPLAENSEYVYLIPAKDPVGLQAILKDKDFQIDDHSFYVHKSWVVLGLSADVEASQKCIEGKLQSIEGRLSQVALEVFQKEDLGLFVDIKQLISVNALTIGASLGFARAGCSAWTAAQPAQLGQPLDALLGQFIDGLSQGIWDADSIVVAAGINADEISIEQYLGVTADSPTAAFFSANPGSEMKSLSSLPALSTLYVGYHGNQKVLTSWTTNVLKMFAAGQKSGWSRAHRDTRKEYEKLNYGTLAIAFPMRSPDQGLLRSISVWEVDNPQRARELDRNWHQLVAAATNETGTAVAPLFVDAEQLGDHQVDVVNERLAIDFGAAQLGIPDFQKALENILYGPDGNTVRTIYMKDRIVCSHGGLKARVAGVIRRIADSFNSDPASDPSIQKTRDQLSPKANLIVMIDAGGIAALTMHLWNSFVDVVQSVADDNGIPVQMAAAAVADASEPQTDGGEKEDAAGDDNVVEAKQPIPIPEDDVPKKFNDEVIQAMYENRSLIGFSLTFEPQACRTRIVIPIGAAKNLINAVGAGLKHLGADNFTFGIMEENDDETDDEQENQQ